jgi:hypothetical protein
MATQNNLRDILNRAIKDIEKACKIRLGDEAQNVINRLEEEICNWERNLEIPLPPRKEVQMWMTFTEYQRRLLDLAQNKYGTSILDSEQSYLLQARNLEACGCITITRRNEADKFVICRLTVSGKKLLDANRGKARI